jgi:hypothetical protein
VTDAGIRALSLNNGPSRLTLGALKGVERDFEPFFEASEIATVPDLEIASCTLSNQFPGPGALVTARVVVENQGLATSTMDRAGASMVGLEAVYLEPSGEERTVASYQVPVIAAGASETIELVLEQPLDPVRLRIQLNPNPGDPNRTNDFHQCFFGTPEPSGLACEVVRLEDEAETVAVRVVWENAAPYEEVLIYRDGSLLAAIPGQCTSYTDTQTTPGATHEYAVRARIEVSKSCPVTTSCEVEEPPGEEERTFFRRGDVDASAVVDITDAIGILDYLFVGNVMPACGDAADADDSGTVDITDPIRVLHYLFTGSAAIPAPGPSTCGPDPSDDGLDVCESACAG